MRREGSGTGRLELMLGDGRRCIEFIRILLGLGIRARILNHDMGTFEVGRNT